MLFWFLVLCLSLAAMIAVCFPLFRREVSAVGSSQNEQSLYWARIAEIEKDEELGRLSTEDSAAAKAELGRKLIRSQSQLDERQKEAGSFSKVIVLVSVLFVPASAGFLYLSLGTPPGTESAEVAAQGSDEPPSIQVLLAAAERRLAENPDDLQGWKVIAPVYIRLTRFDEAIRAYENILRIEGNSPEYTFGLGEALMAKANGGVTARALSLFEETVALQPDHAVARFYIGVRDMQKGDNHGAIAKWQAIVEDADGSEPWLPTIQNHIAALREQVETANEQLLDNNTDEASGELAMISGMVGGLAKRLEENPDDQEGWEMLIRSYMVLGRYEEARTAIEKAKNQFATNEQFLDKLNQAAAALPPSSEEGSRQ